MTTTTAMASSRRQAWASVPRPTPFGAAVVLMGAALVAVRMARPDTVLGDLVFQAAVTGAAAMAWVGALRKPRKK